MASAREQMAEEVSGFQFVPEDLIDVGQDRVVAVTRWVGTGRTSGIATSQTIGLVYTLRDGLVVRQESFRNRADALNAVGLEGKAMPKANERVRVAERLLESLIAREPDMTLITEDFEYEQHFGSTEGRYVGEEGIRRWIGTFYEIWDHASIRTDSVREAADRIALVICTSVRGRLTGIEVEIRTTGIWRFEPNGRASRLDSFNDDEAADAAFLSE